MTELTKQGKQKDDEDTTSHDAFLQKLFQTDINNETIHLPMQHGKYDGLVFAHYVDHQRSPNDVTTEDTVIQQICQIFYYFGEQLLTDASGGCEQCLNWEILSSEGIALNAQLLNEILSKSINKIYVKSVEELFPHIVFILTTLLQREHFDEIAKYKTSNDEISSVASPLQIELIIVKILCIPFSVDLDESLLYEILCAIHRSDTLKSLIQVSKDTKDRNVIVGLMTRLVLTDEMFVSQLKSLVTDDEEMLFLFSTLFLQYEDVNLLCDMLAILSHLTRQSSDNIAVITKIFHSDQGKG